MTGHTGQLYALLLAMEKLAVRALNKLVNVVNFLGMSQDSEISQSNPSLFRLFKSHFSFSLFAFKSSTCLRRIPNRCVCLSGLNRLIYRTWPAKTTRAVWWAICVHSL